jgi:hypothetical protein
MTSLHRLKQIKRLMDKSFLSALKNPKEDIPPENSEEKEEILRYWQNMPGQHSRYNAVQWMIFAAETKEGDLKP